MKRVLSVILALTFLLTTTFTVFADTIQGTGKISLDKAIEIAKEGFGFNTDGYDFNQSYYENMDGTKQWYLNWNSRETGDSISVSIDAGTGDILYMSQWKREYSNPTKLAKYKREEAQKIAEELVKKLQPERYKEMALADQSFSQSRYVYESDSYNFYYVRKVDGVNFQGDGVNVNINKNTLEISNYSFNWTKLALPDAKKAISLEEAKKIFNEKIGIELAYMLKYDYKTKKNEAKLVYTFKYGNRPIDAITGEVINFGYYSPLYDMGAGGEMAMAKEAALTPEEIKAVEDTSKYMTKEKALEIAKKYVTIKDYHKLENASLHDDYYSASANWNLSWSYNNPGKKEYSSVSITIDAISGEVKSLYKYDSASDNAVINGSPKYDLEKSKEIAERFLSMIAPEKFSQTEYRYDIYQNNDNAEKPAYYNFNFIRLVDGIPCPGNSLNVTVNAYTGEVTNFYSNWGDIEFPKAEDIMSLDAAYEALYKNAAFTLKYINHYDYSLNYPDNRVIKLVYGFDDFSGMLDPKTGALLDYNGEVIKNPDEMAFTDIKGHWAENDIMALLDAGIIKEEGNKFGPDEIIKQKDFIKILVNSLIPSYQIIPYAEATAEDYDEYYKQAIARKIITEKEKNIDADVSRIEAAKMIVNAMKLGYLADKSDIFFLNYKDNDKISKENKGYAAIVTGLNIMSGKNGSFAPDDKLTKAEAAATIVKYLKVEIE